MAKCMLEDPRRRFTFGFSAEDTNMTLWYCDRTNFVATDSFNFVTVRWRVFSCPWLSLTSFQEYTTLFHFFLSCAFAQPDALGFDPTIIPVKESDGTLQYDITIGSGGPKQETYRTLSLLWGADTNRVVGHGTRVWKARRVGIRTVT